MTPEEAFAIARYRDWPEPPYVALGRKVIDDRGRCVHEEPVRGSGGVRGVDGLTIKAELGSFRAQAIANALNRGGVHAERMRRRLKR